MGFCDEPFALGLDLSPPNYTPLGKSVFRFTFHLGKSSTDRESPAILVVPSALVMRREEIESFQLESKEEKGWDDLFKQNKNKTTKSKKPAEDLRYLWSRAWG